jgi:hypothetical protein
MTDVMTSKLTEESGVSGAISRVKSGRYESNSLRNGVTCFAMSKNKGDIYTYVCPNPLNYAPRCRGSLTFCCIGKVYLLTLS